jgi:hypothetical protein
VESLTPPPGPWLCSGGRPYFDGQPAKVARDARVEADDEEANAGGEHAAGAGMRKS